ncbi:hypothetical protein J1N35_014624 [Gossypium stocksii]|uniref:DUF4219 domain-containing protein n=1 Tax=Gossypium stocksii TaxID=47602 RepID=A0A9D3VVI5_9ROSI|nr:hypothetical protein J1N35_014624 [Gossypium stocksii]
MSSSSFSLAPPPVLNGKSYHIWVVKMKTYLQSFDLWEVVNAELEPPPLRTNPTITLIRQYSNDKAKRYKTMSCLQNSVSDLIFTRIMHVRLQSRLGTSSKKSFKALKKQYINNSST